MKVLCACEESQAVTQELRALGHEAYSCDILPTSGPNPEWHLQQDVIPLLSEKWDLVIAFPPCTDLAVSGAKWFREKQADGRQQKAISFFLEFTKLNCPWAIENPIGIMSTHYRKPDQIVQPYWFGDSFTKTTCLWLHKLPKLQLTKLVDPGKIVTLSSGKRLPEWYSNASQANGQRGKLRSKTFPGIAKAMAAQWTQIETVWTQK